jgi:acetoacetyl-CoA synthetase
MAVEITRPVAIKIGRENEVALVSSFFVPLINDTQPPQLRRVFTTTHRNRKMTAIDRETLGFHRIRKAYPDGGRPVNPLPQGAWALNNEPTLLAPSEVLLEVQVLELDSTSMKQIRQVSSNSVADIASKIQAIVAERGKMHNPVTNSGGVMIGVVKGIGPTAPARDGVTVGTAVVPLCSISAIPLKLTSVGAIQGNQVHVTGSAIVFGRMLLAPLPNDLDRRIALGAIDGSRLLPQVRRLVEQQKPKSVAVVGCGAAGQCAIALLRQLSPTCLIVGMDIDPKSLAAAESLQSAVIVKSDACSVQDALAVREKLFGGKGADAVLNCVSVPGTEAPTTLLCADQGVIVYFSMATNFGTAVLSTDPLGSDLTVLCGAGVFASQSQEAYDLVRSCYPLYRSFALSKGVHSWMPTEHQVEKCNLFRFAPKAFRSVANWKRSPRDWYHQLHRWSVEKPEEFWLRFWRFAGIIGYPGSAPYYQPPHSILSDAKFFPTALVNLAENLLKCVSSNPDKLALVGRSENDKAPRVGLTYAQLFDAVECAVALLKSFGVQKGDRVGSLLPNIPDTAIFMLATTALGGVWSSISSDSGSKITVDRLGRIKPKVLVAVRQFVYNGKVNHSTQAIEAMRSALPGLNVVFVPFLSTHPEDWTPARQRASGHVPPLAFTPVGFNDPIYILYTSGTTGVPKAIVQSFGVHLNHLKETILHCDLSVQDTALIYTNCGWMLWHWMMSLLHLGTTLVLYDGSPFPTGGDPCALWSLLEQEQVSYFGVGARFLDYSTGIASSIAERKFNLSKLRLITSTGSPLSEKAAHWVMSTYPQLRLSSISGGTELNGCLVIGAPVLPVTGAELQCTPLGMDVAVLDPKGKRIYGKDALGELCCMNPFPSMPVCFFGEEDGARYRAAYFETFGPMVWAHGDIAEQSDPKGGYFIRGRSDATLNPGGVRLGTSDYYEVLKQLPSIQDALVVDVADRGVILFIVGTAKKVEVRNLIRSQLSPKHMPVDVVTVPIIPYNLNFKKMEVLAKRILESKSKEEDAAWRPMTENLQDPTSINALLAYRESSRRPAQASKL